MIAVNYSKARSNLKKYCDQACEGEPVLVTRKEDKNVVVISLDAYNRMQREISSARHLATDRGIDQGEPGERQAFGLIVEDGNK